jgi:AAA domain
MIKLPTEKITEGFSMSNIRMLIYGPSKIGKSTFASKFPDVIFLDTHHGTKGLDVYPIYITDWLDFKKAVDLICESNRFKTVVLDLTEDLVNFGVQHILDKNKIEHQSELKWGRGYDLTLRELEKPMIKLRASDLGIIFICQEVEKEVKTKHATYQKMGPALTNQARKVIMPYVDIIGHCFIDDEGDEEVRKIQFKPSEYVEVGDRTGRLPATTMLRYNSFKKAFNKKMEE